MKILRLEWPPWKTFSNERRKALERFEKASEEARRRCERISAAEDKALGALGFRPDTGRTVTGAT